MTETTILERFISGAAAGFLSQTAVYPLDVRVFHLQNDGRFFLYCKGLESSNVSTTNRRIFQFDRCC